MLEIFLVLIVIILVLGLCLHHHSMKKKLDATAEHEISFIRKAAESSIMASNTVNPIIALVEVTKSVEIIEFLHQRHGPERATEICKVDTKSMLMILKDQKERILQDVMAQTPKFLPQHPLVEEGGFVAPSKRSQENN